jgi:hypothetical protein
MEKIDFIKEISEAFDKKDMDSVKALISTLVDYQNSANESVKNYVTALQVEKERHLKASQDLIKDIQGGRQDITNLSTATSYVMGLATANTKVDKMVKDIVK